MRSGLLGLSGAMGLGFRLPFDLGVDVWSGEGWLPSVDVLVPLVSGLEKEFEISTGVVLKNEDEKQGMPHWQQIHVRLL